MDKAKLKLVKKAIGGDKPSFTLLLLQSQSKLYKIAFSRLKSEADSEDALQNTIILSYENIYNLKNPKAFDTWVVKILINECNKIYFSNKKVLPSDDDYLENESYEESFEDVEFVDLIKRLSVNEQIVLYLYYKNDYTIQEISDKLEIKPNTIKSILRRSRKKLKKLLEDN